MRRCRCAGAIIHCKSCPGLLALGLGCGFSLLGGCFFRGLLRGERLRGSYLLGLDARPFVRRRLTRRVVQPAGAGTGIFADAGGFAAPVTQIVELGAPHLAASYDLDTFHQWRVDREDTFHALAIGNLADGEILVEPRAGARDAHALEGLDARPGTLGHAHEHAHGVTGRKGGKRALGSDLLSLLGLELTDKVSRLVLLFFSNRQSAHPAGSSPTA